MTVAQRVQQISDDLESLKKAKNDLLHAAQMVANERAPVSKQS